MLSADLSAAAAAAVGAPVEVRDRGYALDPAGKAALMGPEAGPLVRILNEESLARFVADYTEHDRAAELAQKRYRAASRLQLLARYGMIVVGMLALVLAPTLKRLFVEDIPRALGLVLVLQLALLLVALLAGAYIRTRGLLKLWMTTRAYAEVQRLGFFNWIMRKTETAHPGELSVLALKLEFVRAYLLEPQLHYFRRRSKDLGRRSGFNKASYVFMVLAIVYTGAQMIIGILAFFDIPVLIYTPEPEIAIGRALVGSAFAVLLAATSLSQLDERSALRYTRTAANLEQLSGGHLAAAWDAAARGDEEAVRTFVGLVTEQVGFSAADWLTVEELEQSRAQVRGEAT